MMTSLGAARAMEVFKDLEEKKEQVRNPTGYLKTAASRESAGTTYQATSGDDEKIHRRATWLNSNVFPDRPIDNEAIHALVTLGSARAMLLFKDVEEKQDQVKNPSGYLKAAVARDSGSGGNYVVQSYNRVQSVQPVQSEGEEMKIHKRVNWLNNNKFPDRIIDDEAIGAMFGLGIARAFELLKEIEGKADHMRNPSGYLKTAALNEGLVPPGGTKATVQAPQAFNSQEDKVSRRARWLNENVFQDRPMDDEAIEAMGSLPMSRAMELFKEVEEKAGQLRNPGGYLKAAVSREGQAPAAPRGPSYQQASSPDKLHRRITWLNGNVFGHAPLDQEAREAAASIPLERAFEILKELEGKSDTVQNPSGYVKASIKREFSGGETRKRPASTMAGPPAKRRA
eukprot:symbB.v1.2.016807.t1/scaffold1292.1/size223628/5